MAQLDIIRSQQSSISLSFHYNQFLKSTYPQNILNCSIQTQIFSQYLKYQKDTVSMINTKLIAVIALLFIGSTALRLTEFTHFEDDLSVEEEDPFANFAKEASPQEKKMVKNLLKDRKDLWKALNSGSLTPEQEMELTGIMVQGNSEFRQMMINQMTADPQFAWLKDLNQQEQLKELKILLQVPTNPEALFESKGFREQMLNQLIAQNPDMAKILDLSEDKQKKMIQLLYKMGSSTDAAQQKGVLLEIMADSEMAAIFMPPDVPGAAHLLQKHTLGRVKSVKHALKVPHFA